VKGATPLSTNFRRLINNATEPSRMVSRSPRFRRLHALEPEAGQIKLFDEDIDYTHRVVLGHVVVQKFRQQRALSTVLAFDKALHFAPVLMRYWLNVYRARSVYLTIRFYTAWVVSGRYMPSTMQPVSRFKFHTLRSTSLILQLANVGRSQFILNKVAACARQNAASA
jgi:hypothetical protein